MDSRQLGRRLNQLVDGELSEAERRELLELLDSSDPQAAGMRKLHEDLRTMKRVVREVVPRPAAPLALWRSIEGATTGLGDGAGGVGNGAGRGERGVGVRLRPIARRYAWVTAAAAVLALGFVVWIFVAEPFSSRLAHADMVRFCSDEFGRVLTHPIDRKSPPCCELGAKAELLRLCGSPEARIPRIPGAKLWRKVQCSIGGVCALRFDFLPDAGHGDYQISVFAIPDRSLGKDRAIYDRLPAGDVCVCLRAENKTVFCFRERDVVFSVLASIGRDEFLARHHPLDRS